MHKFDVKYSFDNYYEYYKFALVKQRILRDIIFSVLFIGIAVFLAVKGVKNSRKNIVDEPGRGTRSGSGSDGNRNSGYYDDNGNFR